jgi:hypothetical protein
VPCGKAETRKKLLAQSDYASRVQAPAHPVPHIRVCVRASATTDCREEDACVATLTTLNAMVSVE